MESIEELEKDFDKKCENLGSWFWRKVYHLDRKEKHTISDYLYAAQYYTEEWKKYVKSLKNNNCDVPEELNFIFGLPLVDGIVFTRLILDTFGHFYYPDMYKPVKNTLNDERYYNLKKSFIAKKYHIQYTPKKANVSYILISVFPDKETQDMAYSVISESYIDENNQESENKGTAIIRKAN